MSINTTNLVKILSLNIRSLWPKFEELKDYCYRMDIDIINIQESWIGKHDKVPRIPNYKTKINKNERKKGAGVISFINDRIKFKALKILDNIEGVEGIFIKIYSNNVSINVGNLYIPPGFSIKKIERLNVELKDIPRLDVITGDFNAHNPKWSTKTNRLGSVIKNYTETNNYRIINDKKISTHCNSKDGSTGSPDLVMITKEKDFEYKWEVGEDKSSDHLPMIVSIKVAKPNYVNTEMHIGYMINAIKKHF